MCEPRPYCKAEASAIAAGDRASLCFAIRARCPCLRRGGCRIQVQGCERHLKPPKHLTSLKRSWTRTPRKTQRKAPAKSEGRAARRPSLEGSPVQGCCVTQACKRMDARFDAGGSFSEILNQGQAVFFTRTMYSRKSGWSANPSGTAM